MATRARSGKKAKNIKPDDVVAAIREAPEGLKTARLATVLGVSHVKLRDVLRTLEDSGAIQRTGNTRATTWFLSEGAAAPAPAPAAPAPDADNGPRRRLVRPDRTAKAEPAKTAPPAPEDGDGDADGDGDEKRPTRAAMLTAMTELLGQIPDEEIAERVGVATSVVARYRRKVGIATSPQPASAEPAAKAKPEPSAPKRPAAAPAPRAAAPKARPSASSDTRYVWKVTTSTDADALIVASTVTDAVAVARAALGDDIRALERVGAIAAMS